MLPWKSIWIEGIIKTMKLLNLKNGNNLTTLYFKDQKVFKVKSLLWNNQLELGEPESFHIDSDIPEMMVPSFPVTVSLIGIKNNSEVILRSVKCYITVSENGSVNTNMLMAAIDDITNLIQNILIYAHMSGIRVNKESYFINLDSPVDLSNWMQYRIG